MRRIPWLVLLLPIALACGAPSARSDEAGRITGFACENQCPLARDANAWRALGDEAVAVPSEVHADLVAIVARNLNQL